MLRATERSQIERAILATPEWADAWIAEQLHCHRRTVRDARRRMIARGDIPDYPELIRRDGSRYPARLPTADPS